MADWPDPMGDVDDMLRRLAAAAPTADRVAVLRLTRGQDDMFRAEFGDDFDGMVDELARGFGFRAGKVSVIAEYGPKGQRGLGFTDV